MDSIILFLNAFLSYIVLFLIVLIVAAIAMCIGISRRKAKDAQLSAAEGTGSEIGVQSKE